MARHAFNTDVIAASVGLAITAVFWQAREPWTPLSAQWPNAILVFMLLCSLALLIKAFVRPTREPLFAEGNRLRMLIIMALLIVWGLALPRLGFIISSVLLFFGIWWFVNHAVSRTRGAETRIGWFDYVRALGISMLLVGAFYYVFRHYLYVPLPRGLWL